MELEKSGSIGKDGKYGLAFKEGKLVGEIGYATGAVEGTVTVKLSAIAVLDAIKAAIPGHFDDVLIDEAKALLVKVA